MSHFFYSDQVFDNTILLPADEAHHALKVLRKKQGDNIIIVDGNGGWYNASFNNEDIMNCKLTIIEKKENFSMPNQYIHIAIAPPKSHDRIEWFVEKAVEIGIQEITFIISQYSERNDVKLNRIKKRSISSMKQSLGAYLPRINSMISFDQFVKDCTHSEKYIGYLGSQSKIFLPNIANPENDYSIIIGPEGGFTMEEVEHAKNYAFQMVSLGKNRLRTETAGIIACHILNIINEK